MSIHEIRVRRRPRVSRRALDDALTVFCGALRRNGQVFGEEIALDDRGATRVVVRCPRPDALSPGHDAASGRAAREALAALVRGRVATRRLDDAPAGRAPDLSRLRALVLSTNLFDVESAVRGAHGERIPAYLLPVADDVREQLHGWTEDFRQHDRIWIGSGPLALAAYRQLADPRSALSRRGRALCRAIEAATRIPTYYDLYRYHGRRVGEETRRCPLCGARWRARLRLPFLTFFSFRCAPCRLLSNVAYSRGAPEDERYARIGEPRPLSAGTRSGRRRAPG